jgi:hypothetical protein
MDKEMKEMKKMMMMMMNKGQEESESDMIRLLKEEIRMLKEKEKDEVKSLKKEIQLLKETHSIEIKTLKAKLQEEKKEVETLQKEHEIALIKAKAEVKKEVKQEEKKEDNEDLSMFETREDGLRHIGGLSYSKLKAIKANFLKTKQIALPAKEFKNTPENIRRVKLYIGAPIKPIEEKKEEPEPQPEEEDEDDEETDEDKAFGEYCDKDEYGVYHIGGIQSDSLTRLKSFYANIPKDLLFGEKKTKCADKMDYLKREFSSKFSNDFSGSKDDYNKLKFYLEN